ncbi:mitogen-activated protein kinase kinase kinase 18-like [Phoenix dactylifera]|uniref:Mitogen-activated protein kinase kinase kinase 18-like n=1 Tax=Phoenix dactylifera TaxID=42345 RepID=A0A8B7CVG2_PHODC|nr:mitogen-activated protein kinase kinase kinase 18-like [Phoenix dactylifera]XP_026665193.1 mitogen-activated protein kinase kinase kinase 18-like [Phoenix dactylifera]
MARAALNYLRPKDWVRGKAVGNGSFGIVSLAMNRSTGELFVVKSSPSGTGLISLKNEADILESLNSSYIVRSLGHEAADRAGSQQEFNLFMEYMAGGSLLDIVEKFGGALEESVIRSYTRQILKGIAYLHRNDIVHCDIKCKNLLLGSSGNIKLADFGCARRLRGSSEVDACSKNSSQVGGTPLWMAPEILKNEGVGFLSDIWSLGCTVIEMATGRPPWTDEVSNPMAAVYKIACCDDLPKLPSSFSDEGLDFLRKCLQKDPKKRWNAEQLLSHPFITGSSNQMCLKEASWSPTSVLHAGSRGNWPLDELESLTEEEISTWRPFSMRSGIPKYLRRMCSKEIDVQATEGWIEVRSG